MGKIREFFYLLAIAVLISLSMIFIGAAFREEYPLWKNQKILEDLRSDVKAEETGDGNPGIDWEKLKKINPDIVGWIKVPGTRIDYPVLQGKDDMEYLNKDPLGEFALSGSIFLSSQNQEDFSDSYNLTFGHHMENGAMYGDLSKMLDQSYLKEHQKGILYLPDKMIAIRLYAALECDAYESNVYHIASIQQHRNSFQNFVHENAKVYLESNVKSTDKIIALSTCMSATTNGRIVVFGVLNEIEKEAP